MLNYFPKYFTNKAITLYFVALLLVTMVFFRHSMSILMFILGITEVVSFFYFSNLLTKKWSTISTKAFTKKIFVTSFVIRAVWVVFSYILYIQLTGQPFEYDAADAHFYNDLSRFGSDLISKGNFRFQKEFMNYAGKISFSDTGYPIFLSFIYFFTGKSIILARVVKALIGAWTVVLIYRLATRNFGENTGRIAAILTMLMPNLILYCGLHLKEVEMVFVSVAFVERADYTLRSKTNFLNIFTVLLLAAILFTFRTALGITALFALITALIFSRDKLFGFGQRLIVGLWLVLVVIFFIGGKISTEIEQLWQDKNTNQSKAMKSYAQRESGNKFADRASTAILAPSIFIIPIPTMVDIKTQRNQQIIHGGNFDKDIMAFFLVISFIYIIKNRKWRDFTLIGAFMLGYLAVIAISPFVQFERFHQPALPFYFIFAAYGVSSINNKEKKYFNIYLVLLFFIIFAWNWLKLGGRGML